MSADPPARLPVHEIIEPLIRTLGESNEAVLQAPPGAGKTTVVPLQLLEAEWLAGRKILLLEPRRVAARNAAHRMAAQLGEKVGETVGYRIRLDSCVSASTRIEVITEGILTRKLQRDPSLDDIGLVIFDEFHERNLDSDLCLALCLAGRGLFRDEVPLKLLVMSATLDEDAVADVMGGAPVLSSQGRQFPIYTQYLGPHRLRDAIEPAVVKAIAQALREEEGSVLAFLPGQREIRNVARDLTKLVPELDVGAVDVLPLYGSLSLDRQQQAIDPAPPGRRKVVLATNLAETSLTIDGVSVVVDSGLAREALFDPATSTTRLTTRRISRASAKQRAGRAGRTAPGVCYRLWNEQQHERLVQQSTPEILQADLAPLALQLLSWGAADPTELAWLDPPPRAAWEQALGVLEACGAAFRNEAGICQLTPHGVRLAQIPLHPRLAHMLLVGCDIHATETACLVAAILSERNPFGNGGADIRGAISVLLGETPCPERHQGWYKRTWDLSARYAQQATEVHKPRKFALEVAGDNILGVLLASAYPDRIAQRRPGGDGTAYQLASGRSAVLGREDPLAGEAWLAVAEVGGQVGQSEDRIYSATPLNPDCFHDILASLVTDQDQVEWDYRYDRFIAERRSYIGSLQLATAPLDTVPDEARQEALLGLVRKKGLGILPWNRHLHQWRSRVVLLHRVYGDTDQNPWPDLSDQALLEGLEDWLAPYLSDVQRLEDFRRLDLSNILRALLPWPLPLELERLAPASLAVPSGSSIAIDYTQDPPVLAVKLQEMFG
ncbi:MAG: ATP-dependent helicase HrpB, partial [Halioglobus sp.]|nr:ATP-dependent helicase HrpB [Halioglobus sp.]